MVPNNSYKTPLAKFENPLNTRVFKDDNNSQREELSDHSEDDLFFIDDYF